MNVRSSDRLSVSCVGNTCIRHSSGSNLSRKWERGENKNNKIVSSRDDEDGGSY